MRTLLLSKIRFWHLWLILAVLLGATLLAACGEAATTGGSTPTPTTVPTTASTPTTAPTPTATTGSANVVQVKMVEQNGQYAFQPATLTITKGTKVIWTNTSDAPHTVTSDTNAFGTASSLSQNQTFSMTFTTAGTFAYHCAIHTYMKATITVTA